MQIQTPLKLVPVHIITGFLGVGKTTALQDLLAQKPEAEVWAVLVNEFGQVGLDQALLAQPQVVVRQVAGGCLCCVSSPIFRVTLARLLREVRPDRLWIEPSGLGHPTALWDELSGPTWSSVLKLQPLCCLLDPQYLLDPRYLQHPSFVEQLGLAELLVINKMDQASPAALAQLEPWLAQLWPPKTAVCSTSHGQISLAWLLSFPAKSQRIGLPPLVLPQPILNLTEPPEVAYGWIGQQQGQDWSWSGRFPASQIWSKTRLNTVLPELLRAHPSLWRAKAVLHTDLGWFSWQAVAGQSVWQSCSWRADSRLEWIGTGILPVLNEQLDSCNELFNG